MTLSEYLRRAIAELTGKQSSKKVPTFSIGQSVLVAIVVGVFALGLVGWMLGLNDTSDQGQEQGNQCAFRVAREGAPAPATEGDAASINTCVVLEKVTSGSRLQLGLSNRPSLPWDRGMLFDFGATAEYCMWMKDMRFSLDMIWLNEQKEIIATRENVSPKTFPKAFCGPKAARYVVEVNAGIVRAGDLRLGQHLNF
jgi:uncharacterized membrane protein (UPF0127 family)